MNRRAILETYVRRISSLRLLVCLLLLAVSAHAQTPAPTPAPQGSSASAAAAPTPAPGTPSATVVEFYRAMRERRFRDAFAMSIFRPAVEPLSAEEFEDLRPDFERQAMEVPEKIELTGEQISSDEATVFMKLGEGDSLKIVPIFLVREKGAWIIEDKEARQLVAKRGKKFFFETRIEVHHSDVERMLRRIQTAQVIYSAQNNGLFGDLNQLVRAGLVPQDVLSTESTGYRFHVTVGDGGKSFEGGAEPARYGRTGRLSFYLDAAGLKSDDKDGKPLKGPSTKK
jgi:hypothetical protein